jgi:hypothetical protein
MSDLVDPHSVTLRLQWPRADATGVRQRDIPLTAAGVKAAIGV